MPFIAAARRDETRSWRPDEKIKNPCQNLRCCFWATAAGRREEMSVNDVDGNESEEGEVFLDDEDIIQEIPIDEEGPKSLLFLSPLQSLSISLICRLISPFLLLIRCRSSGPGRWDRSRCRRWYAVLVNLFGLSFFLKKNSNYLFGVAVVNLLR